MNNNNSRPKWYTLLLKCLSFYILFMIAHYAYDWLPNPFTYLIGGVSETVFQHMKISFFAYILINTGEWFTKQKSVDSIEKFLISRLFSTSLLPLLMLVFFFMAPAYVGQIDNMLLEIIYANVILIMTIIVTVILEFNFEQIPMNNIYKYTVVLIFVISFSLYIIFAYKMPWCDVFGIPPGWE